MPHARTALAAFLALAASPVLHAQDGAGVAACTAVESDSDRLRCYDLAAGRHQPDPASADQAAAAAAQGRAARARDLFARDSDPAIANAGKGSLLDSRWELAKDSKLGTWNFRAYKPVYLLPAFWTSDTNTLPSSPNPDNTVATPLAQEHVEAKFQVSFKTKAWEGLFGDNGDIWMGYTQSSRWQVYDGDQSRPFRETNYEPEVLLVFRNNYNLFGWKGRMAAVGINHQSNGRSDPLSRSWNRVMFNLGLDREDWALTVRPWIRISDGSEDDNPDIDDYMGRGDATLVHTRNGHVYSLMLRHSLRGGDRAHGAVQFDWGFPIHNQLRGHVQVFDGYGESLIDYNHRATSIGIGVSLLDWF